MKTLKKLLLLFVIVGIILPLGANPVSEINEEIIERVVIANQMREYYLNETGPQGNVYYDSNASSITLPEGEGKLLELPLYRQSHNFTCGVACVSSILRYAGYDLDTREDRLFLELGSTPENGTNYMKIAQYFDSVRIDDSAVFKTEIISLDYPMEGDDDLSDSLLQELRASIDNDSPVICVIQAWKEDSDYSTKAEDDGHYVVLVGYKKDSERDTYLYYFMDPSTSGSYAYLYEDEFILRWHDNLDGNPTRIAIKVSYLDSVESAPINLAYHLD